jgi:acyl-CoA hydrolase
MTLQVDQVTVKGPINVGELVTSRASVNHAQRTSMEIGIRVGAIHRLRLRPSATQTRKARRPSPRR